MKYILVGIALCLATVAVAEPPKVTVVPSGEPDKWVKVEGAITNKLFVLAAEPASKWRLLYRGTDVELRVFDSGRTGVFVSNVAGTFSVVVTGPGGDVSSIEIVVVDDVAPKPPVPVPVDELKSALKKAFDVETGDKKEFAKDLAELYRQAAVLASKTEVKTSGDLLKRCQDAAVTLIGNDKMLAVRKVVAGELGKILPTDATLTDTQRKATTELFKKLAVILDGFGA